MILIITGGYIFQFGIHNLSKDKNCTFKQNYRNIIPRRATWIQKGEIMIRLCFEM
jgi:hypothetical protein